MITQYVFLLLLAGVLFLARKKIEWPWTVAGMFIAFLLLATPMGAPLSRGSQAMGEGIRQAGNALLAMAGVSG